MSQKRALITGITGQDGSYLAELLLEKGYEVHGIARQASTFNRSRIAHIFSDPHVANFFIHHGDLHDSNSLLHILLTVRPDEVYHLAAQSHVGVSFEIPEYTGDVTGLGTVRILEALRSSGIPARFYQASSSELYGKALTSPQNEQTRFYPRSPYACAKAYAFFITQNFRESYGMFAVNGILFNHESPRRGENFVTRKITMALARIEGKKQECLYLGNLDAKRDWGYAKEYVEGMWRMLQQPAAEDYVLATGQSRTVREFLELCLQEAKIPFERQGEGEGETYVDRRTGKTIVAIDSRYYRPAEVDVLLGDPSKAFERFGWKAQTDLRQLARLMMVSDFQLQGLNLPA